ncbi:DUF2110 family protein [Halobaculum sp. MBLA0147]|uniref:DUF2110 family protein n=1 Tax=Halobaculum sp. MBLA0147 TaxID=3079934 RepID=UPI00352680E6
MVVLATKCYVAGEARERALDGMGSLVANALEELAVEYDVGVRGDEFVAVTLTGEDAPVARNLLREEWGTVTDHFDDGETYTGTLDAWDEDALYLDAGEEIAVDTDGLGLGVGTADQIRDRFGLVQHLPLEFVYDADGDHELAETARDRLYEWTRGDGRLNVNSATRAEVRATVNRAGHARDIVTVERLGLLEQSVLCEPATDPPGLLAAVGEHLPAELKCVVPQ